MYATYWQFDISYSCISISFPIFLLYYSADDNGGVTLKAFLESEASLLPTLSKLRLLQ